MTPLPVPRAFTAFLFSFLCVVASLVATTAAWATSGAASAAPAAVLEAFYKALDKGDCDAALVLRPGYPRSRCQDISSASLSQATVVCQGADTAALYVVVDYASRRDPGRSMRFGGFATLRKEPSGAWRIDNGSYRAEHKTDRARYLRQVAGLDSLCATEDQGAPSPSSGAPGAPALDALRQAAAQALQELRKEEAPKKKPGAGEAAKEQAKPAAPKAIASEPPPQKPPAVKDADASAETAPEEKPKEAEQAREDAVQEEAAVLAAAGGEQVRKPQAQGFYAPPLAFGSVDVLRACFKLSALSGLSSEAKVTRLPEPDRFPPGRLEPEHQLAPLEAAYRNSIRRVEPAIDVKPVALTFDLCEGGGERAGYDAAIVDFLRAEAVPATFFAGGKWMRSHEERAMQLMADPLFEVGNHSWSHANLRKLTGRRMRNQILWAQGQYELLWERLRERALKAGIPEEELAKIPAVPLTFRFPYGVCNPDSLSALAEYGLPAVQWDVVSGDPDKNVTAVAMAEHIKSQTRPGSIIICHANGRGVHTAEALPLFVPWLREQGFHFVTVSQLLQLGKPETASTCYERTPGDNERYDEQ